MVIGNLSPGQVLTGKAEVYLAAMHPGASFVSSYFFVDVAPWGSGSYTEVYPQFTTVRKVVLDTTRMRNGNHIFVGLVNDSAGRQVWSSIIPFSTNNSASSIAPQVLFQPPPPYPDKNIQADLSGTFPNTQSIEVRVGTSSKKFGPTMTFVIAADSPSRNWFSATSPGTFKIPGLKPSTTYYFEFLGKGINGDSVKVVVKAKSPAATPAPKPARSGSGGSYNGRTCANVRGERLDKAISKIRSSCGEPNYYNASACPTWFGIVNKDNWYVLTQSGNQLGACKY